jgi:hypothetical protein
MIPPQIGAVAEDLLGASFVTAVPGWATFGRPQVDRGIDLYLRRIRSLLTVPVQVKAMLDLTEDGTAALYIPTSELRALSSGYLAVVHLPPPHDQLYERLFLIPQEEFHRRAKVMAYKGVSCFRFTAQFAGTIDSEWAPFAIAIDQLSTWVNGIPGWAEAGVVPATDYVSETVRKPDRSDIGAIGSSWVAMELERAALDRIVIVHDRVRTDPVSFLVHDLSSQRIVGVHVNTTMIHGGRVHFTVRDKLWFEDEDFWMVLVPMASDLHPGNSLFVIPSADLKEFHFEGTIHLKPLTKRVAKYEVPVDDFGRVFVEKALGGAKGGRADRPELAQAS